MSYTTGLPLRPLSSVSNTNCLRVLLINSCVSRCTRSLVAHVKENRVTLMPKYTATTLEAVDRVAKEAGETITKKLSDGNNNPQDSDKTLFHKLEVRLKFDYFLCSLISE